MKKALVSLGVLALIGYIAVCGVMYFAQDRLLYFPSAQSDRPGFHALRLKSGDATLKVWELHPEAGPGMLYFGGQGDDVGQDLSDFDTAFPDRAIYLVNYRGYGGSTGVPREAAPPTVIPGYRCGRGRMRWLPLYPPDWRRCW